ncbi:hypothetical protein HELRODRAFT_172730 [Helobdella robusta]|uniref:Uncharacterized protein n=1 Tax=Helobdella robusta TaxID=6412 RepID=T1F5V5_HELRO|nr:hypothetical protein HELRODRAFT_172730 [Helobdella robusta]ESO04365.1 hypothetical protein HELRODRAFT_172730 [Helobdella robusta]
MFEQITKNYLQKRELYDINESKLFFEQFYSQIYYLFYDGFTNVETSLSQKVYDSHWDALTRCAFGPLEPSHRPTCDNLRRLPIYQPRKNGWLGWPGFSPGDIRIPHHAVPNRVRIRISTRAFASAESFLAGIRHSTIDPLRV